MQIGMYIEFLTTSLYLYNIDAVFTPSMPIPEVLDLTGFWPRTQEQISLAQGGQDLLEQCEAAHRKPDGI